MTPAVPAVPLATTEQPVREGRDSPVRLAFSFDLKLTADDLAKLSPEQIATLFAAAGVLVAAKPAVE